MTIMKYVSGWIVHIKSCDPESITGISRLREDLHLNDLEIMSLIEGVERDYAIEFDDSTVETLRTVDNLVSALSEHRK